MDQIDEMITAYDEEAEATGWYGPEVAFGLTYAHVQTGQSMLDIGIGTGLGSILFLKAGLEIHGIDISPQMLDVCRSKGFSSLHLHDLSKTPYPFDSDTIDHAVCTGVFARADSCQIDIARVIDCNGRRFVVTVAAIESDNPVR